MADEHDREQCRLSDVGHPRVALRIGEASVIWEENMLRSKWIALPKLVRFMVTHFANGVVLGWACGLLLIWLELGRIGALLAGGDSALLTALFLGQSGILFGVFQVSVAVMNLGDGGR